MELLTEEDFTELPAEPAHKWVQLEKTAKARLVKLLQDADGEAAAQMQLHYMSILTNLASTFGVEGVQISSEKTIGQMYDKFLLSVSVARTAIWANSSATYVVGRVSLSGSTRAVILDLTSQIEQKINLLELPANRITALHSCLEDFRREINSPKTRVGAALAALSQVAAFSALSITALAEGPDAFATIQRILGAEQISHSRPEVLLIEKEKQSLLPAPPKQIEDHSSKGLE